ncbi:MAG TPA: response regulator [Polyangiaceae bacterium]|nr:response regulator [Polyangiaceae bacterium]
MTTTLLAVDDSKTMRRVLEITFSGESYKISVAGSADEAIGKLQAERPNVVLVDAALEGTNGYDLCQRLKAAQPGVSVLMLSSKHQPYDRNRGSQVGADDFMDKPFDTQQMIDKVTTLAKKSVSAPMAAPAPQAQPQPDAARLRAQTLAYGNQVPAPSPPAPPAAAPAPAPAPVPQRPPAPVMPAAASRGPAPIGGRQPTMIGTPLPAELQASTSRAAPVAVPGLSAPAAAAPAAAVHALTGNGSEMAQKLGALGLTPQQADAVLALSREVVEKVVWEVVPTLAEALIKEEIRRLTSE